MKIHIKKIIAREFLLLMLTIGIGLITFLSIYLYNFYLKTKSQNLLNEYFAKESIADSLRKPFYSKKNHQEWFYNIQNEKIDLSGSDYNSPEKLWKRLDELALKDSIILKYHTVWGADLKRILQDIGFNNPAKLRDFINDNRITSQDSLNNQKGENIRKDMYTLQSKKYDVEENIISSRKQIHIAIWAIVFSLLFLFIIRYIYYAIKWSVKTLRQ